MKNDQPNRQLKAVLYILAVMAMIAICQFGVYSATFVLNMINLIRIFHYSQGIVLIKYNRKQKSLSKLIFILNLPPSLTFLFVLLVKYCMYLIAS